MLNVTVTEATGSGFITVYPCGAAQPTASSLNYTAGQTVPNMVIAKIGTGGQVCLFNTNPTQLIVDVTGYFPGADAFTALSAPARLPGHTIGHVHDRRPERRPGNPTDRQRAGPPSDGSCRRSTASPASCST